MTLNCEPFGLMKCFICRTTWCTAVCMPSERPEFWRDARVGMYGRKHRYHSDYARSGISARQRVLLVVMFDGVEHVHQSASVERL